MFDNVLTNGRIYILQIYNLSCLFQLENVYGLYITEMPVRVSAFS
jgi:hypothetical protein